MPFLSARAGGGRGYDDSSSTALGRAAARRGAAAHLRVAHRLRPRAVAAAEAAAAAAALEPSLDDLYMLQNALENLHPFSSTPSISPPLLTSE